MFSYVVAPHEAQPHDSQKPRALDCIYMRPLYTMHGGHQLCHIPTGKLVTWHGKLTVIPMPQHIINEIDSIGKKQNGHILKIESVYFPTWSAAVDQPNAIEEEKKELEEDEDASDNESVPDLCQPDEYDEDEDQTEATNDETEEEDGSENEDSDVSVSSSSTEESESEE